MTGNPILSTDVRFVNLMAKGMLYSHGQDALVKDVCFGMEDRHQCMDGKWLADTKEVPGEMTKRLEGLIEECSLNSFNVTLPKDFAIDGKPVVQGFLFYIDLFFDQTLDAALKTRTKNIPAKVHILT